MIEDICFEKFPLDFGADWSMKLLPPSLTVLRTSTARGAISQAGVLAVHEFSTSNQPLSAAEVEKLRHIQRIAKGRPILFKNPFSNTASRNPIINHYGSFTVGVVIRPKGGINFQPCLCYGLTNLSKLVLRPVPYVKDLVVLGTPTVFNPVNKSLSPQPQPINAGNINNLVAFSDFSYWITCRITQLEVVPIKNERSINVTQSCDSYKVSITLEEDVSASLPIIYSWTNSEILGNA